MIVLSIAFCGALIWLSAVVQHVANLSAQGTKWVTGDRATAPNESGFAGRAARMLRNNIESAAMYVPVALGVVLLHLSSPIIAWAVVVYMAVRTSFTLAYWLRINQLRSLSWLIGMICILALAISIAPEIARAI